ncbi:MAG: hypothetical protein AAF961_06225, partial [Planctomycetota bacterium]
TVDLAGMRLGGFASQAYVFSAGIELAPSDYLVVARNPFAFRNAYGSEIEVASEGFADANLSNGGEMVALETAAGIELVAFAYDDQPPWPTAADGQGPSLEIIDPLGDPADPTNWRASAAVGGSPGWSGVDDANDGDIDGDGVVDGADLLAWQRGFGMAYDANDLTAWANAFSADPSTPSAEPVIGILEAASVGAIQPAAAASTATTQLVREGASPIREAALIDAAMALWRSRETEPSRFDRNSLVGVRKSISPAPKAAALCGLTVNEIGHDSLEDEMRTHPRRDAAAEQAAAHSAGEGTGNKQSDGLRPSLIVKYASLVG